jgi:hypothetical protein
MIHLILSSSLVSENIAIPEKSYKESISPLLSVSQITKEDYPVPNMCSNYVRSMLKLSQIDLNEAK